jgi:hypothetical protein
VTATIRNLTIKGIDPENLYNMAPFTWERGSRGTRNVNIDGLTVDVIGKTYSEETSSWLPAGLFELKPKECILNLNATEARINVPTHGWIETRGTITINGTLIE